MVIRSKYKEPCVMSGLKFILDTNIVIGLLKANPKVIELAERVNLD